MLDEKDLQAIAKLMDARLQPLQADMAATKKDISAINERLEEIDQRSIRTQVLMETDITDRLQLLYEGHKTIMGKLDELTPKTRVEALEDTVDMLKDVIKLMRQDISELKKAQ